jgi:hypothetical protein
LLTEELTIHVEPEAARAYHSASAEDRRKLNLLLSMKLRDAFRSTGSLKEIMHDISQQAQARGMTPEVLESILRE